MEAKYIVTEDILGLTCFETVKHDEDSCTLCQSGQPCQYPITGEFYKLKGVTCTKNTILICDFDDQLPDGFVEFTQAEGLENDETEIIWSIPLRDFDKLKKLNS